MTLTVMTFVFFILMNLLIFIMTLSLYIKEYKNTTEKRNILFIMLLYAIITIFEIIYLIKVLLILWDL